MKLSISNIGWNSEEDVKVFQMMKRYGFTGLEIAPTRIFTTHPYENLYAAKEWYMQINHAYGFEISSLQSIGFGRTENLFGSSEERGAFMDYLKKAVDFSSVLNCKNLVFGCPKNRNIPIGQSKETAFAFFKELGEYALKKKTVIGMEANPPIYKTNYINTTAEALELIDCVDVKGFKLNLDIGTMIENDESVELLKENVKYINHVHISEPELKPIKKREIHRQIADRLLQEGYQGFVSIEMGRQSDFNIIENIMLYVKEIFG